MPSFSSRSLSNLYQCHESLIFVAQEAIKTFDFVVICGHRGEAEQMRAYKQKASKAKWLQSPHNYTPSLAFDACPYPINWDDEKSFLEMGRAIMNAADKLGIELTWGADFNGDGNLTNDSFRDLPHFQLRDWKGLKGK